MAYQFVHMESFSRKGDSAGRSTSFVFSEARRDPVACVHVEKPAPPIVVYGSTIDEVQAMHDAAAAAAITEVKGGKPRKIRQDQKTLHTVVASHPFPMDEICADPAKRREAKEWELRTVAWLRLQYGDDLKSVIRHEDEKHFHIHAYIVPIDDPEMRAQRYHPGAIAKRAMMSAGPAEGEDTKALSKRADAAYKQAMRVWQDSYHESVGIPSGLARLGPARRRLTRMEWQAEQVQAKALRATIERAKGVKTRGESFISSKKADAARIAAEAAAMKADVAHQLAAAKAAMGAVKEAQDRAVYEQRRAALMIDRVRKEASRLKMAKARLQRLPGLLRGLWDGFRRSSLKEQLRAEVVAEVDALREKARQEAQRASVSHEALQRADVQVRNLRDNLREAVRELWDTRQELAALRPLEQTAEFRHSPRRP